MSGLEMCGLATVTAAGIGLGVLNAPRAPAKLEMPAARVFAEREPAEEDVPALDAAASRTHDEDGAETGCGGG